jgi:c(7)-type cytochrome triheme protein
MRIGVVPATFAALAFIMFAATNQAPAQTGPIKLKFAAKQGEVTYYHFAHAKRLNSDCAVCHPKLYQQSAAAPLKFGGDSHKPAVKQQSSCSSCHRPGGTGFAVEGNCQKRCHTAAAS